MLIETFVSDQIWFYVAEGNESETSEPGRAPRLGPNSQMELAPRELDVGPSSNGTSKRRTQLRRELAPSTASSEYS